ncbi:MAG: pyridoxine 5'-phosphate synthase [Pseudomonadota bacterium]
MTVLSVNLNKIAVLRNSREGHRPSVLDAARTVINAGAQGITVHPRSDLRHIRPHDVLELAQLLSDEFSNVEFNIEGNPAAGPNAQGYPGFDALIEQARPAQATLVPDSDDQLTSDHGWDLQMFNNTLAEQISRYQSWGARVSLFIDPDTAQIAQAKAHGADRIELYTGPFAETVWAHGINHDRSLASFQQFQAAAEYACQIGLGVNAGHDLDQQNLPLFDQITVLDEVSIGHALIADALDVGLFETVRAYLEILNKTA